MKITLTEWGARNYNPSPSTHILRSWAKTGQISPQPEKVGKTWMVDENAARIPFATHTDPVGSDIPDFALRVIRKRAA